jgi:FMN phosphatase YigB (HAD superfamily)
LYALALKKAGVAPADSVFIDDQPWALAPAQALGMTTILYTGSQQLREQLVSHGLLPNGTQTQ